MIGLLFGFEEVVWTVLLSLQNCSYSSWCVLASPLVLHSFDLLDPRDVGDLAFEAGLQLAAGQGEHQQKEDNLLLGKQI